MSERDREATIMKMSWTLGAVAPWEKNCNDEFIKLKGRHDYVSVV